LHRQCNKAGNENQRERHCDKKIHKLVLSHVPFIW
jgi:hypothetical protein